MMKQTDKPTVQYISFEQMLEQNGYIVFTNIGISMLPLLRQKRDVIEIRKKGPGRCKKYDVVFYKRREKYLLHRILRVLPDGYIIAGDNNTFIETDIGDEQILGVMKRIIRNGKEIDMENNKAYHFYVHLWCDFYPIRMAIIRQKNRIWHVLSIIKHKIV